MNNTQPSSPGNARLAGKPLSHRLRRNAVRRSPNRRRRPPGSPERVASGRERVVATYDCGTMRGPALLNQGRAFRRRRAAWGARDMS